MAENGVLTIERAWTPLADVSWRNIENIFEAHEQQQKTPPRRVVAEPSLPAAPRKSLQQPQIRRQGLKPRRLTYDLSSPDSGIDAGDNKENQPPPIRESSGKSRAKRRQLKDVKDSKTKPTDASELRLRLRI